MGCGAGCGLGCGWGDCCGGWGGWRRCRGVADLCWGRGGEPAVGPPAARVPVVVADAVVVADVVRGPPRVPVRAPGEGLLPPARPRWPDGERGYLPPPPTAAL